MSSKQAQKRKAENQGEQPKKSQPQQQQTQQKKPQQQQQQQQQKKPQQKEQQKKQKAPEPEPEEDDDEDEDDGADVEGEVDEEALKAIEAIQGKMDGITDELEAFDKQMNAEIYAIQKKYLLKKKPILARRDSLFLQTPGLWKTLFANHQVFLTQLDDIDHELLDALTIVEMDESYTADENVKQQITGLNVYFTFKKTAQMKAGRYKKSFTFNESSETLECVPVETKDLPFVDGEKFVKAHPDSFLVNWFTSEGEDDGILAAQDALSSELYVDPLQLYTHVSSGGLLNQDESDDEEGMEFGEDGELDGEDDGEEDDEAPELVD